MQAYKRVIHSRVLNRMAHADVFEIGSVPEFLFVLFGGSGLDQEEYDRRSRSIIPVFAPLLQGLASHSLDLVMVYVSAPYDLPFNRFATHRQAAVTWNVHVATEVLEPWAELPFFVTGFSGGASLGLNGLHASLRCFGGAGLGADAIPRDFVCPDHWVEKLWLYVAPQDRVANHSVNRKLTEALVTRGQAKVVRLRVGGHQLADYATEDGLGSLIKLAGTLVPSRFG
jgi:hypothetical protein